MNARATTGFILFASLLTLLLISMMAVAGATLLSHRYDTVDSQRKVQLLQLAADRVVSAGRIALLRAMVVDSHRRACSQPDCDNDQADVQASEKACSDDADELACSIQPLGSINGREQAFRVSAIQTSTRRLIAETVVVVPSQPSGG